MDYSIRQTVQLRLNYFTCLRKTDSKTAPKAHTLHSAILRCAPCVFLVP